MKVGDNIQTQDTTNIQSTNQGKNTSEVTKMKWSFEVKFWNEKINFSINDFSRKCDQIRWKLRIWSHLLEKSLMENFIFRAV